MIDRDLLHGIAAVDRLNSWVRSKSYGHSSAKKMVYHMKDQAISAALKAGMARARGIKVVVTCRDCGGSGRYIDGYGDRKPHCRQCDSNGKHWLRFIETSFTPFELVLGFTITPRWHTPWMNCLYRPCQYEECTIVEDWQPNTPGADMAIDDVCRCLITAERVFPDKPPPDYNEYAADPMNYALYLGRTDETRCSLCGGHAEQCGYVVSRRRLVWTDNACGLCRSLWNKDAEIFEKFPWPMSLLQGEHVREWLRLHSVIDKRVAPAFQRWAGVEIPF